jgi:flavorubredoxin
VAECLNYLGGLKPTGMIGAAFGSYGWSGEAVGELNGILEGMKVRLVGEGLKTVYVPDGSALKQARELGETVAREITSLTQGDE